MFGNNLENESLQKKILIEKSSNQNILSYKKLQCYFKLIIISFSLIFFTRNLFLYFSQEEIEINNRMQFTKEEDIDFSGYSTTIKPIAIYLPETNSVNDTNKNYIFEKIKSHINLAKNHGIFGFAFYYFLSDNNYNYFNEFLDLYIEEESLDTPFLLIINNENNDVLNQKAKNNLLSDNLYISDIKNYISDKRYIHFDNKPAIGINHNNNNQNDIQLLKQKLKENELEEIFILSNISDKNVFNIIDTKLVDGLLFSTSFSLLERVKFFWKNMCGYFYTHLLYYNKYNCSDQKNINIFRTTKPLKNYPELNKKDNFDIYRDYSPEKFYFLNKIIVNWTLINHNENNQFIFVENFQDLEPDNKLGYTNINILSKVIFNLPLISDDENSFNLINLKNRALVLVQAHIYYTDLLPDVVNKTNNIPVPFDLYITTNNEEKKDFIEKYLKLYSKANKYEILVTPNKGRDVIPFLIQLEHVVKAYKYLCHIHTKKHGVSDQLGNDWQIYLYENLLGNKAIISQILSDFENNNKLGIIFPEHFYVEIKYVYYLSTPNYNHMCHILHLLFPERKLRIKGIPEYPSGNMFWARTDAIYQIFTEKVYELSPEERGQADHTFLHGLERTWLYLANANGYSFKSILYYL